MYKNKDRALNRESFISKKKKVASQVSTKLVLVENDDKTNEKIVGRFATTPHRRYFFELGNVRKLNKGKNKLTIQERKSRSSKDF